MVVQPESNATRGKKIRWKETKNNERKWQEMTGNEWKQNAMNGNEKDMNGQNRQSKEMKGNYRTRKEQKMKPPRLDHEMCDSFYTLWVVIPLCTIPSIIATPDCEMWHVGVDLQHPWRWLQKFHAVFAIAVALSTASRGVIPTAGRATHSTHWTSEFAFLIPFTSFTEKVKYRNHSVLVLNSFDETWFYIISKGKHIHII